MKRANPERIQAIKRDVLTVPNLMTAGRLAALPFLYRAVKRDPARHWIKAGVMAFTDKGDGWLAAQEDKGQRWADLGFRRSEFGRIGDPVVDTAFSAALIHAGEQSGAVPRTLSRFAKIQKATKTVISGVGVVNKQEVHVNYTGKLGEFMTATGVGFLLGSTGIERPARRFSTRAASSLLTATGISLSAVASVDYARQAHIISDEPSQLEQRIETAAEAIVRTPERVMHELRGTTAL